jgi:hypothetical protein
MRSFLKVHLDMKRAFDEIQPEFFFYILLKEGNHLFMVKITTGGDIYTKFQVKDKITKEAYTFILKYDHDILDHIPIPERERCFLNDNLKWRCFEPVQTMSMTMNQAAGFMQQLYEIKFRQFKKMNASKSDNDLRIVNP